MGHWAKMSYCTLLCNFCFTLKVNPINWRLTIWWTSSAEEIGNNNKCYYCDKK